MRAALVCIALAALTALTALTGCALDIGPADVLENAKPAPLAIVGPDEGLFYTEADDVDPVAPGIQLTVRVDVQDEAIDVVHLALDQHDASEAVTEDLAGRRAAFFDVTLASTGEHPALAVAHGAEARAVFIAR
jgi:hypothetical protein